MRTIILGVIIVLSFGVIQGVDVDAEALPRTITHQVPKHVATPKGLGYVAQPLHANHKYFNVPQQETDSTGSMLYNRRKVGANGMLRSENHVTPYNNPHVYKKSDFPENNELFPEYNNLHADTTSLMNDGSHLNNYISSTNIIYKNEAASKYFGQMLRGDINPLKEETVSNLTITHSIVLNKIMQQLINDATVPIHMRYDIVKAIQKLPYFQNNTTSDYNN